jgi:hypothetical protein
MLYQVGHLDGLQCKHILQNVKVPSKNASPGGKTQFHEEHSSIHDSYVVPEWLSLHADVELIDWPP